MRSLNIFIFLFGFITNYCLANTYVIWRINNLLGNNFSKTTLFLIIFATSSYIVGALIDRFAHNIFTRIIYGTLASWMGILMFLLSSLLIFEIINLFFKVPPQIAAITILITTAILTFYSVINAFSLKNKEISIPIKNLKKATTIVQLSDLHVGTINNGNFLEKVIQKVNNINPDFVVITGDLVDGSGPLRHDTYAELNEITAPIYFVMGNHETYEDVDKVLNIFKDINLKVLMDEKIETNNLQIIGLNFSEKKNAFLENLEINPNIPSLLLAHSPNIIKIAAQKKIDLQLSGHTHNGQIMPFNFIVKLFYPYIKGLYQYQDTQLYVSPGTGTWGPFMRLGSRNEITLLKLIPAQK